MLLSDKSGIADIFQRLPVTCVIQSLRGFHSCQDVFPAMGINFGLSLYDKNGSSSKGMVKVAHTILVSVQISMRNMQCCYHNYVDMIKAW